ncbi:MAG TPA: M48 family metallopeptidase [Candidatus Binatia bacterium]|nr:M48 family metallopeptidase [Candidatus Binatia bacterium]
MAATSALIALAATVDAASFKDNAPARREHPATRDDVQLARLRAIMLPLVRVTKKRIPPSQIQLSIVEDASINAASGGEGRYFVTTGLLNRATDDQLRGVLAHEIAHEDLGHPAKAQIIGAGLSVGAALLERIFPGSAAIAPVAGTLISNNYTRPLELEADRHAVTLLERAGYSKQTLIDTLTWLMRRTGNSGGGLSSHPATSERIQALRALR